MAMVLKDPVGAIPFFEKAVQILPPFPEAHYNLGTAARVACDIPKAVKALRAALRYSQDDDGIAERARKELHFLETTVLKESPFPNLDAYLANAKLFDEAFECLNKRDFEKGGPAFPSRFVREPHACPILREHGPGLCRTRPAGRCDGVF